MGEHAPAPKPPATPTRGSNVEKSPRPILKRKGTTGNSSLLGTARFIEQQIIQEPKVDMAASFLQFCAMCEKQIMTPSNSILYCSEACRRKDSIKPLSAAIVTTTPIPAPISPPPSEPSSPRPILSPRLPTGVTSSSSTLSIPAELHDHSSDLDPTEWKPKLPTRESSEAFKYLSRFHRSTSSMSDAHPGSLPPSLSLGNTPTTTSSSLSTSAGGVGGMSMMQYSSSHNGYDYNTRPLPLRQNRWYSFNGGTPKGIDLVTPHVVPAITVGAEGDGHGHGSMYNEEGLKWEKRKVMFATPTSDDGLKILFGERK